MSEKDQRIEITLNVGGIGKLCSLIKGDAFYGSRGFVQQFYNYAPHFRRLFAFDAASNKKAAFSVHKRRYYRPAFGTDNCIAFPMAAFSAFICFRRSIVNDPGKTSFCRLFVFAVRVVFEAEVKAQ